MKAFGCEGGVSLNFGGACRFNRNTCTVGGQSNIWKHFHVAKFSTDYAASGRSMIRSRIRVLKRFWEGRRRSRGCCTPMSDSTACRLTL
jgi:hypothetical protein